MLRVECRFCMTIKTEPIPCPDNWISFGFSQMSGQGYIGYIKSIKKPRFLCEAGADLFERCCLSQSPSVDEL
jgi:hypothetical protein